VQNSKDEMVAGVAGAGEKKGGERVAGSGDEKGADNRNVEGGGEERRGREKANKSSHSRKCWWVGAGRGGRKEKNKG